MKRNKEAVLKVLTMVEEDTFVGGMSSMQLSEMCTRGCSEGELESAKLLLLDSGYLVSEGNIRITWAGHSLLEELRG
ncbi:hypothetical protein CS390_23165 [Pseudomonas sp. HLS-6]|uniref:hypothetical protein n=2 Tax=Pseudomonas TaxID=286 RepID=UPI000C1A6553|nr:hypothetical protein [Pseudomonas sp. HLS-6]ATR85211.1 hypothetical protein CS390_23165 [Pseudomonas sp. HLS-6]